MKNLTLTKSDQAYTGIYINGEWIQHNEVFEVYNPTNQKKIAEVADADLIHGYSAIEYADKALNKWSDKTSFERATYLKRFYELIQVNRYQLAEIIHEEQGKPIVDALGEVEKGAEFVLWFSEECKRIGGETFPSNNKNQTILVEKVPIGVVTAITPWNLPIGMILRKISPALAAGCTVVIKPSHETPLSAIKLVRLIEEAGFPSGVVNLITTKKEETVGNLLISHPSVNAITFTGSTKTGYHIQKVASNRCKKLIMELGGHAPFIVFEDYNIEEVVESLIKAKFRNSGQTCTSVNMLFIQKSIYTKFIEILKGKLDLIEQRNYQEKQYAPLINKQALKKVSNHTNDAIEKGASLLYGSKLIDPTSLFVKPIVLGNITSDMIITQEETFGPVLPVKSFIDEKEIIDFVKVNDFGLIAYIYTSNIKKALKLQKELKYGIIGINNYRPTEVQVPFGGFNASGIGKEAGNIGIEEFLLSKSVYINYN